LLRLLAITIALLCFVGAAMLGSAAAVPAPAVPDARDVRSARELAGALARVAAAEKPTVVVFRQADMEGAARVLSNGLPRLRVAPETEDGRLVIRTALRLSAHTWLNTRLVAERGGSGGYPVLSARIGALPVPTVALEPLLGLAHWLVEKRARQEVPDRRQAVLAFDAMQGETVALLDLPRGLLRAASRLAPEDADGVDADLVEDLYRRAMRALAGRGPVPLVAVYAVMFEEAPLAGGRARAHARAAMVAAAMVSVGPRVRRLAKSEHETIASDFPTVLPVQLAGRDDLAKHFSLSAAIAAATGEELGRALGTWKELDDSLPGGSGFSFVDLAADRGGLRLGQAARDPARARTIAEAFAAPRPPELLPLAALGFMEGMSDRTFEARYGNIETEGYKDAVARIDRALDTLPVMQR
jgi:hypothetical protein